MDHAKHGMTADRLRENDAAAWAAFYDSVAADLLAYVRRLGSRRPDDILGEVMVQVVRDLRRFTGSDKELRPWVFTIARNRVIDDARRRSARLREVALEDGDDENLHDHVEFEVPDLDELSRLLDLLTPDQREVIWLRFGTDMSLEDTARVLGKDREAVAALTFRALRRLRKLASPD